MFNVANKEDLCQVSLTGIRSLILLGLLLEKPCSLEEIRAKFIEYNVFEENHSNDILRIDLNTLRAMGCEISRAGKKTDYKYQLYKHPFDLKITDEEISVVKRAYNKVKDTLNIYTLIQFDYLFKKIANHVCDEKQKQALYGISSLKHFDINKITELEEYCKYKKKLNLIYKAPTSKYESEKEIIADSIVFKNEKVYLYGFDLNLKEAVMLHLNRICKILSKDDNDGTENNKNITVVFKLKNFGISGLNNSETILNGDLSGGFVIKGTYHNEFIAIQRILSFGASCTVIEPDNFKEKIINSLKKMKEIYNE